jgi:hypothetical protein
MASIALGLVGAGIGSLIPGSFLGMSFTSLGWSIGSALGSAFFGPQGQDIKGPRLSDKSVSTSAYGNLRPIVYGTYRVGGEVIWSTNLKEHKHKEESGKGGGGGGSYTTYTYTVSFAVALCEGPITGVRKIWLDSKLVYTQAEDATAAELEKSDKMAKRIAFYTGTTTQMPDPTIEAALGAGNVPAYRGTAYLVFEDLDVTNYGNRIPQITVEVVGIGTAGFSVETLNAYNDQMGKVTHIGNGVVTTVSDTVTPNSPEPSYITVKKFSLADGTQKYSDTRRIYISFMGGKDATNYYYKLAGVNETAEYAITIQTYARVVSGMYLGLAVYNDSFYEHTSILKTRVDITNATNLYFYPSYDVVITDAFSSMWVGSTVFFYHFVEGRLYRFDIPNRNNPLVAYPDIIFPDWDVVVDTTREDSGDHGSNEFPHLCFDEASGDVFVGIFTKGTGIFSVKRYTSDGEFIAEKFVGLLASMQGNHGVSFAFDNGILWINNGLTTKGYDWETEAVAYSGSHFPEGASTDQNDVLHLVSAGNVLVANYDGTLSIAKATLTRLGIGLDECVTDICDRVGIPASDITVTDLASDSVRGYMIAQQMPARGAIQTLAAAYFFDGVESDGKLKFVKRGGAASATLDDADIGCYESGEAIELWESTRIQEEELPRELTLTYAQFDADYQQGAQFSRREAVESGNSVSVQLAIAFTDDEAKSIVDAMNFSAWHNRHGFKIRTWQKYNKIEPTDIISVGGETLRITSRAEGINGLIEIDGVRELAEIYTGQIGTGASGSVGGQTVKVGGPTNYELLDIPNLRDADYLSNGIYWAAAGMLDDWDGAALLKSTDNGDNWTLLSNSYNAAVIGQTSTALGDFDGGNIFDESNIVRVSVNSALSSATRTEVLNGANACLIGDEILQFRTATLVSTGVYDLSGLLRGRRGTEWSMGSHEQYERFVLLDSTSIRFAELQSTDYNTTRLFGAVTMGDTIEDVVQKPLVYSAQNLKPFAPAHIGGGVANGDWTFKWKRRTRFDGEWVDGRDAGDDEATESYEVAVMNGTSTVRTLTSSTESTTYTSAQQTADFGGMMPSVSIQVRQVGTRKNSEWEAQTLYYSKSIILNHFEGTNGQTTFTDTYANSISRGGSAVISTAWSKFGSSSLSLPAFSDYIDYSYTSRMVIGARDFCIEFHIKTGALTQTTYYEVLFDWRTGGTAFGITAYIHPTTKKLHLGLGTSTSIATQGSLNVNGSTALSGATEYHLAFIRIGTSYYITINGAVDGSGTYVGDIDLGSAPFRLGRDNSNNNEGVVGAFIDGLRVSVDSHRYPIPFTAPTAVFTE